MKQSNNLVNKPISGESFFDEVPKQYSALDKTFVPLDTSVIWHFNYLFWKHFSLWEETYNEQYEASLPSGISESHKDSFIENSAKKFLHLLLTLEQKRKLPNQIIIVEQGPGTGVYAKKFLDFFKAYDQLHKKFFYQRMLYVLQDTSEGILDVAYHTLQDHHSHIERYVSLPDTFNQRVIFARHSNVWDQFPARLLVIDKQNIGEILVQAVVDRNYLNVIACPSGLSGSAELTVQDLRVEDHSINSEAIPSIVMRPQRDCFVPRNDVFNKNHMESFITSYPLLWKPLMRCIKFRTKIKKLSSKELSDLPHSDLIMYLAKIAVDAQEIVISNAVLDNLEELIKSIDWSRNGYAEIVDIIVPTMDGFYKDRRPRKYDGSIATVINGPLIKAFLQTKNKHARFDKIRGINYTVTMRNNNLQTLLEAKDFISIGEIAARRDEPIERLKQNADALFTLGIDVVGFSDQAFVKPEYLSQKEIVETEVFRQLPGQALMPILKTRNKSWEEIQMLIGKLKDQGVANLFVVTGDPGLEKDVLHTSMEITKKLKNDFFIGGVVNPDKTCILRMKEKIAAGTNFFIMQATYDKAAFDTWVRAIKKEKLYEHTPIIAAIVPIVSKRTLSVLQFINDMSVAQEVIKEFEGLDNQSLREKGIILAQEMVTEYKAAGIFSGIYVYSKSHEVICQVMGFPYHKTSGVKDSL